MKLFTGMRLFIVSFFFWIFVFFSSIAFFPAYTVIWTIKVLDEIDVSAYAESELIELQKNTWLIMQENLDEIRKSVSI